jgi:hypothetical protein
VEVEIRPEPSDEERRAIVAALGEEDAAVPNAYRSRWREAALEEGVAEETAAERGGSAALD